MCSSPKSSASAKPISAFSGSIMSGLNKKKRQQFALRANEASDKREIIEHQAQEALMVKGKFRTTLETTQKPFSLLSYFHLA